MASLAVAHNLPINLLARKLIGFLRSLGVKAVFDIGATREISLQESADEFCQRYKRSRCKDSSKSLFECLSFIFKIRKAFKKLSGNHIVV